MSKLQKNLERELKKRGWNPYNLEAACEEKGQKLPQPTIQRALSGTHREPRSSTVKKMAIGLGITEAQLWGFDERTDSGSEPNKPPNENKPMLISEPQSDYIPVKMGSFHLQAGVMGYTIEYLDEAKPPLFFHGAWFHANGYKPEKLVACKIKGDSMEPKLFNGDIVVINTEEDQPKDSNVFAVNYEGELVIKRLLRDAGHWYLSSDNPDKTRHPNKICNSDYCIVIGRVIYRQSSEI